MYTLHFGLREAPFSIAPDPQYLYMSERHREALAHLVYGIGEGGGFVVLTGEVGTGKTTICRCLLQQLPPDVGVALVLNPKLTALELLKTLCDELRLTYPPETTSVKILVDTLYRHVLDAHAQGRRTVLIIDEAQNLSTEALEQVRLLTNLETTKEKLLQVILIGQPELATALKRRELRQLAQRVTARYHLQALSQQETSAYIAHRLGVAGRRDMIFRPSAIRKVHRLTGGLPRLINVVCDRALLGAYAAEARVIDARIVDKAAREVFGRPDRARYVRNAAATALVVVLASAIVGALLWTGARDVAHLLRSTQEANGAAAVQSAVTTSPDTSPAGRSALVDGPGVRRLPDLLVDPSVEADQASAFGRLLTRWGLEDRHVPVQRGCDMVRLQGLACMFRTGTWTRVRRLDLPAVLELTNARGEKRYATVMSLSADAATLALGSREFTFPLNEIDPFWDGGFMVLWKKPTLSTAVVEPGMWGKNVAWVRQRLDVIDGKPAEPRPREAYDEDLQRRITAFQRSRSLTPDGIVGEETLAHLASFGRDNRPSLTAEKP